VVAKHEVLPQVTGIGKGLYGWRNDDHRTWNLSIDTTKIALQRLGRAVVLGAKVTDAGCLGGKLGRTTSALLAVSIADGQLENLLRILGPSVFRVDLPARIQVGMRNYRCPDCGGECPPSHHGGSEWEMVPEIIEAAKQAKG